MFLHKVTHHNATIVKNGRVIRLQLGDKVIRETEKPICGNRSIVLGECDKDGNLGKKTRKPRAPKTLEVATPTESE